MVRPRRLERAPGWQLLKIIVPRFERDTLIEIKALR
jgi:hypothetical protein